MIVSRPSESPRTQHGSPLFRQSKPDNSPESDSVQKPAPELGFEGWVDTKLSTTVSDDIKKTNERCLENVEMDKSKRKYYNKRRKRLYGSDSDDDHHSQGEKYVELKPEVVELPTLHKREEELYFYDTFASPWEKEKHYKMVYQLEKKYFPNQCLDKAFVEIGETKAESKPTSKRKKKIDKGVGEQSDKGLMFFDEERERNNDEEKNGVKVDISEKKVGEFFKFLKKVPSKDAEVANAEPYIVTRSSELPPRWDSPYGTVVLINKPKGKFLIYPFLLSSLDIYLRSHVELMRVRF